MIDEGVIKYNCNWVKEQLSVIVSPDLKEWRDKMYELKLIGEYSDVNIGYGNISEKLGDNFLISGTQTGKIYPIKNNHFTLVTQYDINKNCLTCKGEIKASSESLTHAAVYEADESIKAIIHIHNKAMWVKLLNQVPTTNKNVPYGTPNMALEIKRLFQETNVVHDKIIVMAGHDEGIIAFGKDLNEAGKVILGYFN